MKHLLVALLTYLAAIVETGVAGNSSLLDSLSVDTLGVLAAVVLLTQRFEPAIIWLLVLGLVTDTIGAESLLGTHAVIYVVAGFVVRTLIARLHERQVHVLCVGGLCFLAVASVGGTVARSHASSLQPDWSGVMMTAATTWLVTVLFVASFRAALWLVRRFRNPSTSGGAMGTPVGLSVN
jgi:cell shape-determining protein MreD